ncbi:MAG: hypothetical protein IKH04_02875 [Kiritimatiellae bacterium]|nr:hypothetical protein [Kiritimatiellia bacterium]
MMDPGRLLDRLARYAGSPRRIRQTLRTLLQARAVSRSPLFDRAWYLRQNPDIAKSGESPELHYLFAGAAAGQDPGPGFCGAEYLELNPGAAASGLNPLVHYERVGRRAGLRVSRLQPLLGNGSADPDWRFPTLEEHQAAFPAKVAAIRARVAAGARIKSLFLVSSASMFPARPLLDAMRRSPRHDARIAVIPDLRGIASGDPHDAMRRAEANLARAYPADALVHVSRSASGHWSDPVADFRADIVCYPSPYNLSSWRCNPRRAIGDSFLPIYANYGYPCTSFAAPVMGLANYACMWKVFLESAAAQDLYRSVSPIGGANGKVVGSIKMDALPAQAPRPDGRKCVLVAPHHSVAGGANGLMALSNFMRLADFIAELPGKFPGADFLFRPHPFLFPVLERPSLWGRARCERWRERFLAHPNARWTDGGDPLRDFAAADAIVQDCSSFLADWSFTGKPCCYILDDLAEAPRKFNAIGLRCLEGCRVATDAAGIEAFIRNVVMAGDDPEAGPRERVRAELAVNWPHAADTALSAIERELLPGP